MQIEEARPPYVMFEVRAVEDRDASIAAGQYKTRDENFVLITPQGSKDRIERVAHEWFDSMDEQVRQNRMPADWVRQFKAAFEAWKAGREIPVEGTAILTWPVLSPSQSKSCIDAQVRTVEDLAAANEETLNRIGMGARALKEKATVWVKSAGGNGKVVEEIASLKASNADLKLRNESLETQIKDLAAQVAAQAKK